MKRLEGRPTDELVAIYEEAAGRHHRESNPRKVNRAHDRLAAVYRELRARGLDAQRALLDHPDPGVRSWAAAHALEFAAEEGEPVLEQLVADREGRMIGFGAEWTLKVWRRGELRFP
jgi:hypothetical protein